MMIMALGPIIDLMHINSISQSLTDKATQLRLPTVNSLASKLNVSPSYSSDMLGTVTGQNKQQHIHNKLIEKAKEILLMGATFTDTRK